MRRSRGGIYLARVGGALALLGIAVGLVAVLAPHSAIGQVINPLITQAAGTNVVTNTKTMNFVDCSVAVGASSTTAAVTCAGIAPGGAAGGDLAGTYPNPTVKKGTFTGASSASGTASFDLSGASGVFKTTTGAVTIGTGTCTHTGPVISNIGGTTSVPWSTTGVASQDGFDYTGTAPASVASTPGTNAGTALSITGAVGGATSNAAGTAGNGEGVVITTGAGGAGTAGNANGGAGGTVLVTLGTGGAKSGGGAAGAKGTLTARASAASFGTVFQVQNSTPTTNFTIADTGSFATATGGTYTAGSNILVTGDKLVSGKLDTPSVTVGGATCTLGSSCTPAANLIGTSLTWTSGTGAHQYTFGTGAGNGTPAATNITVVGGNNGGTLTFTTTSAPAASDATIVDVYYGTAYANAPSVTLFQGNSAAASVVSAGMYIVTFTDHFSLRQGGFSALSATTAYIFHWQAQAWA